VLIPSRRHTAADLVHWRVLEAADALRWRAREGAIRAAMARSTAYARAFADAGPCYLGVSWGKDSVLLAHLVRAAGIAVPLVWVCVDGRENPDCLLVRDAVLARWPGVDYHEIHAEAGRDGETSARGFEQAAARFGDRYLSGVRAQESYARTMRLRGHGVSTARTSAPLSHWTAADVFAAAYGLELPLHPVYAMTAGGRFPREHIRTSSLGGMRGTQRGRRDWERAYYLRELEAMGRSARAT
jgi:phosphoadenosine phosphosulfate reductase